MKKLMIAVLAMGVSNAMADGFVCETLDGALSVKVYNQTHADAGTRNAAVMVLSDNTIQYGRKTIAKFDADNQVLDNRGASYLADVDLRYNDSGRGGENIGGTKLAQLDAIALEIRFAYDVPVNSGEVVEGVLTLIKRNGSEISIDVDCERYLKN
jgi:hypothetical protein